MRRKSEPDYVNVLSRGRKASSKLETIKQSLHNRFKFAFSGAPSPREAGDDRLAATVGDDTGKMVGVGGGGVDGVFAPSEFAFNNQQQKLQRQQMTQQQRQIELLPDCLPHQQYPRVCSSARISDGK